MKAEDVGGFVIMGLRTKDGPFEWIDAAPVVNTIKEAQVHAELALTTYPVVMIYERRLVVHRLSGV